MDKLESIQVGGEHYKGYDYQPLDLIENLNLSFAEGVYTQVRHPLP